MRIMVVSNLFPPDYEGGFEINAHKLAVALRGRGHDVEVMTSEFGETYAGSRDEPAWVHRIFRRARPTRAYRWALAQLGGDMTKDLPLGGERLGRLAIARLGFVLAVRQRLGVAQRNLNASRDLLSRRPVDLAYVFGLEWVGATVLEAFRERGIPVVHHSGDEWLMATAKPSKAMRLGVTLLHPMAYRLESRFDIENVLVVSEFLRRRYLDRGFDPAKIQALPRGIEFEIAHDVDRSRLVPATFFMASRITHFKGYGVAIEAAGKLHAADPSRTWRLRIAGEGDAEYKAVLRDSIKDAGLGERVQFLGKITRDEVVQQMKTATAFISASIYGEPFANTIIEALASGTPLIGSKAGSMEEVVTDGQEGLLYEKTDSDALASHMKWTLDHPREALEIARRGTTRVEEAFTLERVLDRTEAYFADVLRRTGKSVTP